MLMIDRFIISVLAIFMHRRFARVNDVGDILHFFATQPALFRIHLAIDIVQNRISIHGLVLGRLLVGFLSSVSIRISLIISNISIH